MILKTLFWICSRQILEFKVRHEFLVNLNSSHSRLGAGAMVRDKLYSGLQQKIINAVEAKREGREDTPPPRFI